LEPHPWFASGDILFSGVISAVQIYFSAIVQHIFSSDPAGIAERYLKLIKISATKAL
jgi:hypothetical protein